MSFPSLGDFTAFPSLGTNIAVPVYHHRVRCDGKSTLVISFRKMVCSGEKAAKSPSDGNDIPSRLIIVQF